ncbi:hypothetical protein REPUB_Repub04eG0065900 [Reevesia pubescens]
MQKIPNKFAEKFWHELSSVATFIVPNGRNWEIRLTKAANGVIWVDQGWHEFVEYYSIRFGHFLVFRYERNSSFKVLIFDKTACEVEYPSYVLPSDDQYEKNLIYLDSETEEDDSIEVLGAKTPNLDDRANREVIRRKSRRNAVSFKNSEVKHAKLARACKRPRIEHVVNVEEADNLNESKQMNFSSFRKSWRTKKRHPMNQNAKGLPDLDLSVQLEDLKQQFDGKILKITVQRANLQHRKSTKIGSNAQGNQANKTTRSSKQVQRSKQDEKIKIFVSRKFFLSYSYEDQVRAIRAVNMFKPKNPCFMIIMLQCNFTSANMHVPAAFAVKYLIGVSDHIKVEGSNGRKWVIESKRVKGWGLFLRKGCITFWRDNNLKLGDICIFELRDKKAAVYKVSILHADSD